MAGSVLALRHGRTEWNAAGRIQGRRDEPLSEAGRARLAGLRVPAVHRARSWISSPLRRCLETAELLGAPAVEVEPRIIEMDWGRWEGWSLEDLRARDPQGMRENEGRGLDFRPAGGESPREVGLRIRPWLREIGQGRDVIMLSHKGVVRALLAWALGWDMTCKAPVRLDWERAHLFSVDGNGRVHLREPNIALETVEA